MHWPLVLAITIEVRGYGDFHLQLRANIRHPPQTRIHAMYSYKVSFDIAHAICVSDKLNMTLVSLFAMSDAPYHVN